MTHNSDVALLLGGGRMAVLGLRGTARVYDCDLERASCSEIPPGAEAAPQLVADAIAYYRGADLLYRSGALGLPAARVVDTGGPRSVRELAGAGG